MRIGFGGDSGCQSQRQHSLQTRLHLCEERQDLRVVGGHLPASCMYQLRRSTICAW